MKRFNFWRSLFVSAMAVMAFAACSDKDDDNGGTGEASITVNGKAAVALGLTAEAGAQSEEVSIVSSGAWTLTFEPAGTDWCTASAVAGKAGTTAVKFTAAALPSDVEDRSVTAVVETSGAIFGVPYTKSAKIKIQQSVSGEVAEIIYKETFGTAQVASNTDVDKYTAWNKTGEGAADVTYAGTNVSIRNTNTNVATSYDGASTAPLLFFSKVPATFIVQNIALTAEQTKLQLTFGGQQVITNGSDYTWSNENMLVALSADGKVWSTIEYTTNGGDQNADAKNWVLATANFTLKAPAEKLYIRFKAPKLASATRIDDITLQTGIGGQEVDLAAGDPVATVKINEITAAGDYQVEGATVIAAYEAGFLMQDETGIILVYPGSDATIPAVGKVVTVRGEVSVYGGALQFGQGALITETGEGTVPAAPEAVEITADNIAGFMNSPKIIYVKTTGTLTVDDKYRNLVFTFETSYKGSIVAPAADAPFDLTALSGSLVDVTGWFLNNANGTTYLSILATDVKENSSTPMLSFTTKPQAFAGKDPEVQKIDFTSKNIPTDALVEFSFTGENADKFNVESQDATSVTIKAVGNAPDGPYSAKLVAKLGDTVLAEVAVSQEKAPADTDKVITVTFQTQQQLTDAGIGIGTDNKFEGEKSITVGGYTYILNAATAGYGIKVSGDDYALFIGKQNSYIEFPAIENFKLVSVEIVCGTNMANVNKLNIADAAGTTYSTDFISSNETKGTTHKFECAGTAANTAYRLVMLADKNLQINGWTLTYSE